METPQSAVAAGVHTEPTWAPGRARAKATQRRLAAAPPQSHGGPVGSAAVQAAAQAGSVQNRRRPAGVHAGEQLEVEVRCLGGEGLGVGGRIPGGGVVPIGDHVGLEGDAGAADAAAGDRPGQDADPLGAAAARKGGVEVRGGEPAQVGPGEAGGVEDGRGSRGLDRGAVGAAGGGEGEAEGAAGPAVAGRPGVEAVEEVAADEGRLAGKRRRGVDEDEEVPVVPGDPTGGGGRAGAGALRAGGAGAAGEGQPGEGQPGEAEPNEGGEPGEGTAPFPGGAAAPAPTSGWTPDGMPHVAKGTAS